MKSLAQPKVLNKEILLNPQKAIITKTTPGGAFEYVNDYFQIASGYKLHEIMGQQDAVIRHPDMPKVILRKIWVQLLMKKNIKTLVKNISRDGRFYWTVTDITLKLDASEKITSFLTKGNALPMESFLEIKTLYKKLQSIEKSMGVMVSEKYLSSFLKEKEKTYESYIRDHLLFETGEKLYNLN